MAWFKGFCGCPNNQAGNHSRNACFHSPIQSIPGVFSDLRHFLKLQMHFAILSCILAAGKCAFERTVMVLR